MKRIVVIFATAAYAACLPASAQADFGIHNFDLVFTEASDDVTTQAGSHPFALTVSWDSNIEEGAPDGHLRDLLLDLPPGLVGSRVAMPSCSRADFAVDDCPGVAAVGVVATSFDEAGKWVVAPVFSLVPSEGAVASLGFRVADAENVVLNVYLSEDTPYRLIAFAGDLSESVDLLGVKLQLWGVPAAPAHDGLRGSCGSYMTTQPTSGAVDFEFESVGGECHANVAQSPLLTLPTACEGPLETFYGVSSWEGDFEIGGSLTHDEAGDPQGLTGCGILAFSPLFGAVPTTKEADSPTGFDLSMVLFDEGLTNPSGIAQSTVRAAALALPEGIAAAPVLATSVGSCSEAAFAAEGTGKPDEGCPASSQLGMAEVESPLLAGPVEGSVFRATPFANATESPMALYLAFADPARGILVKQPIAIEPDPETDQLIAYTEELPQFPFSDLELHLEATGGPLINPPLCGSYKTVAAFVPWADDSAYVASSTFAIASGPNGGPCPTKEEEGLPVVEQAGGAPAAPSTTPPDTAPSPGRTMSHRRHRCPKGRRRVRRNGKSHCVRRHRRKAARASYP
jgi:hypothetical protein